MNKHAPKRIFAFLIDILIYIGLWVFFYFNIQLGDYLSWLLASLYLLIKDGLFHGQSLGKFVMKLQVVSSKEDKPVSLLDSFERNVILVLPNLFRFIPFFGTLLLILVYVWETYLLYTHSEGQRWGDQFAKTKVIPL